MPTQVPIVGVKVTSPLFVCPDHVHSVYLLQQSIYHFDNVSLESKKYFLDGIIKQQLERLTEKKLHFQQIIFKAFSDKMDQNAVCQALKGDLTGKEILTIVWKYLDKKIDETDDVFTIICCDCTDN